MADTTLSDLNSISGSTTASGDLFHVDDVSASESKSITRTELANALVAASMVKFQFGEPTDGSIKSNECILYIDNTVSPYTWHMKTKDSSSPNVVFTIDL